MKLFLVARTDRWDYDEHDSAIIRAENESEVIFKLFSLNERGSWLLEDHVNCGGDKNAETRYLQGRGHTVYGLCGFTPENTKITELTYDGEVGIILSSFNAG